MTLTTEVAHSASMEISCLQVPALTTHTSNSPLPVNPSPTDLHTGTSKESPPIHNIPPTNTSSTIPTSSIPLILQESADTTCTQPCDPPYPSFLSTNLVATREMIFGSSQESNQDTHCHNYHATN